LLVRTEEGEDEDDVELRCCACSVKEGCAGPGSWIIKTGGGVSW
jgi:hypothetical protein